MTSLSKQLCALAISSLSLIATQSLSQPETTKASRVVADGAVIVKAGTGYSFTEGPAADKDGNVYFTDQPNDKIFKWTTDGKIELFMEGTGRSNGMFIDSKGNIISCADLNNELWSIDKRKKTTVLVRDFEGKKLNGPNDLWVDEKDGIYFTDPFYKRDYWKRTDKELQKEDVYYLSPDRSTLVVAASDLKQPNGIIGSNKARKLYVADIGDRKTYEYPLLDNGKLGPRKLFAEMGSDGMTIDSEGNIYLTGKGVTVFDKSGKQIDHIDVDEPWTANVTFGGKDRKTLFITASGSVYTLKMRVAGVR